MFDQVFLLNFFATLAAGGIPSITDFKTMIAVHVFVLYNTPLVPWKKNNYFPRGDTHTENKP